MTNTKYRYWGDSCGSAFGKGSKNGAYVLRLNDGKTHADYYYRNGAVVPNAFWRVKDIENRGWKELPADPFAPKKKIEPVKPSCEKSKLLSSYVRLYLQEKAKGRGAEFLDDFKGSFAAKIVLKSLSLDI